MWYGSKPDVSHLRTWGCIAYVHVQRDQRTKTASHTTQCVFIGYPEDHKAWRFYDPKARKVIISRDVIFDESSFYFPPKIGATVAQPVALAPQRAPLPPNLLAFLDDDEPDQGGVAPVDVPDVPVDVPAPVPFTAVIWGANGNEKTSKYI
jgi:hypothetical protein